MYVFSVAKKKNSSSRRLQSCQFSAYSQCGTVPLTLRTCFPAYSPVLSVVSRKVSHEGHVLFSVAAVASALQSSSFSVLSSSLVLTVAAYYLHSTLP